MNDDYLWDGSGEPDPEVQRLEKLLGRFRHDRPAPEFPAPAPRLLWFKRPGLMTSLAAAAIVLIVFGFWISNRPSSPTGVGWQVQTLAGAPLIGDQHVSGAARLAVGQQLETDSRSRATLAVGTIGQVEVEPDSRVRLITASERRQQLALDRGTINAQVSAPPWLFLVDTPSAQAFDLGCAYTLHVDDSGASLLRVTFGWVQLELGNRQALVPSGAAAATRPGFGPGTPYYEDASERFKQALAGYDFPSAPAMREAALQEMLAEARPHDALTLVNLLWHTNDAERTMVYDRLTQLLSPPPGVTREGVLRRDDAMIGKWMDRIGVGHPKKGKG